MTAKAATKTKRCSRCTQVLPVERFAKRTRSLDGRQAWCQVCVTEAGQRARREAVDRDQLREAAAAAGLKVCRNRLHLMDDVNTYVTSRGARKCRECMRATDARRHARHRARRLAQRKANTPEAREARRVRALAKFGLTPEMYDAMAVTQADRCAICGTDQPGGRWGTRLVVDHDHATGVVRGLLCSPCNVMLGNAQDDPARLRAAATYLERGDR